MREYKGIIKDIIVEDSSIDKYITFIVKVGFRMLKITLDNSIKTINFRINEEVIVVEDKVLGKKSYNIFHKGDDYND